MKCHELSELLVAYLHDEVTRSERTLIQAHLRDCETCQRELAMVAALQDRVRDSLQRVSAPVTPSGHSWSRLQAGLAEAERRAQANPIRRVHMRLIQAGQAIRVVTTRASGRAWKPGVFAPVMMVLLVVFGAAVLLPARWQDQRKDRLTDVAPAAHIEIGSRAPVPFAPVDLDAVPVSGKVLKMATDPYDFASARPCAVCLIPR